MAEILINSHVKSLGLWLIGKKEGDMNKSECCRAIFVVSSLGQSVFDIGNLCTRGSRFRKFFVDLEFV
jgi:hypothetical protein